MIIFRWRVFNAAKRRLARDSWHDSSVDNSGSSHERNICLGSCILLLFLSSADSAAQTAMQKILGPVTAPNTSPWSYYDIAEQGNARDVLGCGLTTYAPVIGSIAPGSVTFHAACNNYVGGTAVADFCPSSPDNVLMQWADGGGDTVYWHINGSTGGPPYNCSASPPTLTSNECGGGAATQIADGSSPYSLYHCASTGGLFGTCDNGWFPAQGWNYYDAVTAAYLYANRTGNSSDLTVARNYADLWWEWGWGGGTHIWQVNARLASPVGMFVRALDGKSGRFVNLYNDVVATTPGTFQPNTVSWDSREAGYQLMMIALGAIADPDSGRHSTYCSMLSTALGQILPGQDPAGFWAEKNNAFPYRPPGESPWRTGILARALAHSYDAMKDTSAAGCNNTTTASNILTALTKLGAWMYTHGYSSANRGLFYDADYVNIAQNNVGGAGTISVALASTTVTGTGSAFTSFFSVGDYIAINHADGQGWAYLIDSITDDTHLTIHTPFSNGGSMGGTTVGPGFDAVNETYTLSPAAPTNCGTGFSCWAGFGTTGGIQNGDRHNNIDAIWIMGWLYKTTLLPVWKARGDELFSAAYGGNADGPGGSAPCAGPACDNLQGDVYIESIRGCASNPGGPPCNPITNYGVGCANAINSQLSKYYGQGSGIGAADNYLAWRLVNNGSGTSVTKGVRITKGVRLQ